MIQRDSPAFPARVITVRHLDIIVLGPDLSSVDVTNRLNEVVKQIRIVKEEVNDPEVTTELEQALEPVNIAIETLEDDN